ncbi:hypothetical protein ECZC05_14900 [Escherichia coli]|nr:hypothetical protein ECZC02_28510 [Escherichia coli]GJH66517.1 hypothetical protein ECZC05_14900 [Escherichia coli]GJH79434.1 hypothetical protein ECZC07_33560 [Escherichia coli]GJH84175.1 hypothetical protein ECZC08_27450 [Escherichia coli]GJI01053.1 hypothetical protein ECZC11_34240 [Escherichia coli]
MPQTVSHFVTQQKPKKLHPFTNKIELRFDCLGKGVDAVGVDIQGLPVSHGCLLQIAHSYTSCIAFVHCR